MDNNSLPAPDNYTCGLKAVWYTQFHDLSNYLRCTFFPDGAVATSSTGAGPVSSASGNECSNSAPATSSSGSSRLGVREMMQRAVTAARSASSSLAGLDVEEDAPIPTLHWPPDALGDCCHMQSFLFPLVCCDISLNFLTVLKMR